MDITPSHLIPPKRVMYIEVLMDSHVDEIALMEKLPIVEGVEFYKYSPFENKIDIEKEKEWLIEVGITEAFNTQEYLEFLGTTKHTLHDIKEIIQRYLDNIIKTDKLIIIDQYIFPTSYDSNYANFFIDILDKYLPKINEITFITPKKHNETLKTTITNLLKARKPTIQINIKKSEDFHDRFWISDPNNKGVFLGTSLNGWGKKYALIDYINTTDVREIISTLRTQGLI